MIGLSVKAVRATNANQNHEQRTRNGLLVPHWNQGLASFVGVMTAGDCPHENVRQQDAQKNG